MDLQPIQFAIGSRAGFSRRSNRSDLVNLYPHFEDLGSKTQILLLNTEGFQQISTDLPGKILGLYEFHGVIYIATQFEILFWVPKEGFVSISKYVNFWSERVFISDNGTQIIFVGYNGYAYEPRTTLIGNPSPIRYTVKDTAGNESNTATASLIYLDDAERPAARSLAVSGTVGDPTYVYVTVNDIPSPSAELDTRTISLTDRNAVDTTGDGYRDLLVVGGQGTWTVDYTSGYVKFNPLATFTGNPTPQNYTVKDTLGNESNQAAIFIIYDAGEAPVALDDFNIGYKTDESTTVNILENDVSGTGGDIDPTTVMIEGSTDGTLQVSNQGIWTTDPVTGEITFTPNVPVFINMDTKDGWYPADTVGYLDGYFIFNRSGTGQFFISKLYSVDIDPLDWATGEAAPDDTRAVIVAGRQLWILGTRTTEVWYDSGDPLFPFTRIGGAVTDVGIAAANTLGKIHNTILFVGSDYRVYKTNGYTPTAISTAAIELLIDTHAVDKYLAFTYFNNGHYFYVLHLDEDTTVVYDMVTSLWHSRVSCNNQEDPIVGGGRWKIDGVINKYDDTLIYGFADKAFYEVSTDIFTEDGIKIRREAVSQPLNTTPNHVTIAEAQVDMEAGGYDDNPISNSQVWLQLSDDDGKTWGNRRVTTIGRKGNYKNRARWQRLGQFRDVIAKVVITDPIPIRMLGFWVRS